MKKNLLFLAVLFSPVFVLAQVTQVNNNNSLEVTYPLSATKTIVVSDIDSSIWVSDATLPGTVQISPDIKYEGYGGVLSGKFIFRGSVAATGSEIYITDGTPGGTVLLKEIVAGTTGSDPGDFVPFNGYIYFSAVTAAEGRELWRTNGTGAGTALFKDIMPGPNSSNGIDSFHLSPTSTYVLFAAQGASEGIELWKTDGTPGGTALLKDINTANAGADSSNPNNFLVYNSIVLFLATDATHGEELWKTDGTAGNTVMVKDINTTAGASSTKITYSPLPGFDFAYPVFFGFHVFNNKVYFTATDGASVGEMWTTDGTAGNTTLVKDIVPGAFDPLNPAVPGILVIDAVNLPSKFIFPVYNGSTINSLWESDGTPAGTKQFMSFTPNDPSEIPFVFVPYSYNYTGGIFSQQLFMGNKFFFIASNTTNGYELWISDGTVGNTSIVKDINPGAANGIDANHSISYLYTTTNLFFAATDATHGNELWKTDGTSGGTSMVKDIYPNAGNSEPQLSLLTSGGIIFFTATDGDDANNRDLFVVNGVFQALPLKLTDFAVSKNAYDAILQWSTSQETNSKNFVVQRSFDAMHFEDIGSVAAAGNSATRRNYNFNDIGIVNSGKSDVYYRLKLNDQDGKSAFSKVVLLKLKPLNDWNVRLLSNPVKGSVNVLLSGITGTVRLSIKDILGKTVFSKAYQNINGEVSIGANLQSGTYLLVTENNNERKIIKLIK